MFQLCPLSFEGGKLKSKSHRGRGRIEERSEARGKKGKKSIWKSRIKDRGEEFKEKLGGDKASKEGRERERAISLDQWSGLFKSLISSHSSV